ncbi:MAG: LptF/LptG family permease, partial [Fimbriimonadaceae bacterium]|nr:LptF/LptG family permease [Fimbriimonadaceae bacterium]
MKRLDRLVIKELIGPWAFGVALFGALLFAATYLGRVAEYISKGLSGDLVGQATMLILPGILVQTFAMSMLLASLLAFGRLSSDSEIVAIRAAGVSLFRVIAPVSGFALCVAAVAFLANETIVPASAKRLLMLADQITRQLDGASEKGTSYPITEKGVLKGMVVAKSFIVSEGVLLGALITSYDK